jgi:transposase
VSCHDSTGVSGAAGNAGSSWSCLSAWSRANSEDVATDSIMHIIDILEKEIAAVEKRIQEALESDSELSAKAEVMRTVQGVGPVTSWTLLAFLPEIGMVGRKRIASLVGLVPWPDDSSQRKGRRFIHGGRSRVRTVLYMAATTAIQHIAHLRVHYQKLTTKSKPHKVAIVAVMRKSCETPSDAENEFKSSSSSPRGSLPKFGCVPSAAIQ